MKHYAWGRTVPHDQSAPDDSVVNDLREALQRHRSVQGWELQRRITRSHEMYLYGTNVESMRSNVGEDVTATLFVASGDSMGSAAVSIGPGEEQEITSKVEAAVRVAGSSEFQQYPLVPQQELPDIETRDPMIVREPTRALERAREELSETVDAQRNVKVASAEFFAHDDEIYFENSEGLVADRSATRALSEVVLLGRGATGEEAENQSLRMRRRVEDLEIGQWVSELGMHACDASQAEVMKPWNGPVLIRAGSLRAFLGPLVQHTSGEAALRGVAKFSLGDSVTPGAVRGDRLTAISDATLPYGMNSRTCDGAGLPAQRTVIIEDGRLKQLWADQRRAHYLETKPTGGFANLVIPEGSRSVAQLAAGAEVLEVIRFSWLTPDRGTGDFSSEIRFGYMHRNGRRTPIKGGSVNGNIFGALEDCHFSRERDFVGDALVPRVMRVNELEVFGA